MGGGLDGQNQAESEWKDHGTHSLVSSDYSPCGLSFELSVNIKGNILEK